MLGTIPFIIACVHCICPQIHLNSTHQQAQHVANKIINKRITRNSLKMLALPFTAWLSDSVTEDTSDSSVVSNNNSKSKHVKNAAKPSNKKHSKIHSCSKSKKTKGQAFPRTLKSFTKYVASNIKVLRSTPTEDR